MSQIADYFLNCECFDVLIFVTVYESLSHCCCFAEMFQGMS